MTREVVMEQVGFRLGSTGKGKGYRKAELSRWEESSEQAGRHLTPTRNSQSFSRCEKASPGLPKPG